jgi:ankyrin repeat protein
MFAITFGRLEVAKALIKGGAKLDLKNKDGNTALLSAAFLGQPEIVKALLEKGADVNAKNNDGSTALASAELPWELAKGILDFLSAIVYGPAGVTLDYEKIKAARPVCAQILRDAGGKAAAPAGAGAGNLQEAVFFEDLAAVKKLIAGGANVNEPKPDDGGTPLHTAVFVCNIEIVKALIAAKANVDAKNNKGETPLYLATMPMEEIKPIYDFIGAILQKKFDLERIAKDRVKVAEILRGAGGPEALQDAVFNEDLAAVKKLIEGGANVNAPKPDDGSTPLHTAVFICNIEIVKALIAAKADVNAQNKKGEAPILTTTLPWEVIKPGYDFIGALAQKKFDLERIAKDRVKVAEILRAAGAK